MEDLTGLVFGNWKVLKYVGLKYDKRHYWLCQNTKTGELRERRSDKIKGNQHTSKNKTNTYDYLLNKNFGLLKVIEITNKTTNNWNRIIKCQCECGNIREYSFESLLNNGAFSCGCTKRSSGEQKIKDILTKYKIPFEEQKMFDSCRFQDTGRMARFDFYVNNKYIIEYDGQQHFKSVEYFGGNDALKRTKQHDKYKNNWCKKHKISIIRIPYTRFEELCLNDLLLTTSQYII